MKLDVVNAITSQYYRRGGINLVQLQYCCEFPNWSLFEDTNGGKLTAVVWCQRCQKISAEIFIGEEE